ncbi:MAG: hypothetical protein FRX49_06960 [Trebouxia sp. A1-2]|nr:MAG: hypothetical protein FRX49_06960 [Trebouxia sp. A1-2]
MPETLSVNEGCTGRDSVLLPRGTNAAALMVLTMPIRHETAAGDKLRGRAEADKAAVRAVGGFEADTDRQQWRANLTELDLQHVSTVTVMTKTPHLVASGLEMTAGTKVYADAAGASTDEKLGDVIQNARGCLNRLLVSAVIASATEASIASWMPVSFRLTALLAAVTNRMEASSELGMYTSCSDGN